jgi:hypothetical protein
LGARMASSISPSMEPLRNGGRDAAHQGGAHEVEDDCDAGMRQPIAEERQWLRQIAADKCVGSGSGIMRCGTNPASVSLHLVRWCSPDDQVRPQADIPVELLPASLKPGDFGAEPAFQSGRLVAHSDRSPAAGVPGH